jgi:hypothetical protein
MCQGRLHFFRVAGAGTLLALALSATGRGQEQLWKGYGDVPGGLFGEMVANAGDVNGDGVADLIAGARADNAVGGMTGMARVISGLDGTTIRTHHGSSSNEQFGFSVAGIGDVDGDGFADYAVGSPLYGFKMWVGRVSVYSGQSGALLYHVQRGGYDRYGWSLAATGDLNGDAIPDFVVGSAASLYAEVVSGKDGTTIRTLTPNAGVPVYFGYAVASGGDVDGDGVMDVAVGDPDSRDLGFVNGSVWIFSGADGAVVHHIEGGGGFFGGAVAMAGDVNGDGRCDLLAGAPTESSVATGGGQATLFSGLDGTVLYTFAPTSPLQTDWNLGNSLCGAGDVNHDGFADLLVGAPGYSDSGGGSGTVFLYSGRDGLLLYHFEDLTGTDPKSFGYGLALAGDVNGDGVGEICAGAPSESSPTVASAGSVSLFGGDDLFVHVTPRRATAGDPLEFVVGQGAAGGLYALFLVDVNGTPFNLLVALNVLDATGRATYQGQVPPGLGTIDVTFKAFAIDTRPKVIASGIETLYLH